MAGDQRLSGAQFETDLLTLLPGVEDSDLECELTYGLLDEETRQ